MYAKILSVTAGLGLLAAGTTGCVSTSSYEAMQHEADTARVQARESQIQYAQERLKVHTLEKRNKELKQQTDKWEGNLRTTIERLELLGDDWGQVRDDLIRLNIDRELRRMKGKDRTARATFKLEPRKRPTSTTREAREALDRKGAASDRDDDGLEAVLKEFRSLLGDG